MIDLDALDRRISAGMRRRAAPAARIALGIVFVWFGILKPLGVSAAEPLVLATVDWMPIFPARTWLHVIGGWEVAIGVLFLFRPTVRLAIPLMLLQMAGTFLPLVVLPEVTFQPGRIPWGPTLEGQYILKNLVILALALVVGGSVRKDEPPPAG